METKVCKLCGKELPIEQFYHNSATKDGYDNKCKECRKLTVKAYKLRQKTEKEEQHTLSLANFDDHTLFAELRKRGYSGELRYSKVVNV